MRAALLTAAACAVAAAPAGAVTKAYWRLDVKATQHVEWTHDGLFKGCSNSITRVHATGTGDIKAQDHNNPWAVAQNPGDPKRVTMLINGTVPSSFSVDGSYVRHIQQGAYFTKPPDDPKQCPKPLPGSPDCGVRGFPDDALMYVNYIAPGAWTYGKPKPKGGVLTLSGPYIESWVGMPPFQICGGASGDDTLAGTWYDTTMRPMAAPLPVSKLFGKAKHFSVTYHNKRTVQTAVPGGAVLEDDHPVTTSIHWTVRFSRTGAQLQDPYP
jgi:hypothetical protein